MSQPPTKDDTASTTTPTPPKPIQYVKIGEIITKGPYTSDPFAPNYRHIVPWDDEQKALFLADWQTPLPGFWAYYESAAHAEHTRPFDQLDWKLAERGLLDKYRSLFADSGPDMDVTRACLEEMLREEAPELLERFEACWRLIVERVSMGGVEGGLLAKM